MDKIHTLYGFRVDPMTWVENDLSLRGAVVRKQVFKNGSVEDRKMIEDLIKDILSERKADGTFIKFNLSETLNKRINMVAFGYPGDSWNSQILLKLLELGLPSDSPEVQNALDKLSAEALREEGRMSAYMLIASGLCGWQKDGEPANSLKKYSEEWSKWNGWGYCPWGPSLILKALWYGRKLADVERSLTHVLQVIHDKMNQAGIINYRDPWAILDAISRIEHELADKIVKKMIPLILRSQLADGSWGKYSYQVFKALKNMNLLETLRSKPRFPVDTTITRTIPAPEGDLYTMTWGAERLWLLDVGNSEVIGVSPDDGEVMKRFKIPLPNLRGIAWVDGNLAVTQKEPEKQFVLINPENGEIIQQQDIFTGEMQDWVGGLEKVGNEIWVADTFNSYIVCYPLKGTSLGEAKGRGLGGPGPEGMASMNGSIWHYDWLTPRIIYRSDLEGKLLDWCSIPLDFSPRPSGPHCNGLAFDGKHLWALDGGNRRICIIERNPETLSS